MSNMEYSGLVPTDPSNVELRAKRFETDKAARFEEMTRERARIRATLPSLKGPIRGTCTEKCPEYERFERELHFDLSTFEMVPGTEIPSFPGDYPKIEHSKAVKKYQRPAAGNEQPLPEDVRPPKILNVLLFNC